MSNESIFTKIINRQIPATIRYEDDQFIVFDDIHPIAPIHVLVVPKQPYQSLEHVPADDTQFHAKLLATVRKAAQIMKIADAYKIHINVGEKVQAVQHLHVHVLGGWHTQLSQDEIENTVVDYIKNPTA